MFRMPTRRAAPRVSFRPVLERLEDYTLLDSGFLDPTFGMGGRVLTDFGASLENAARAVAAQADGKLVVAGSVSNGTTTDFALARYLANGALDTTFGMGGRVTTAFGPNSGARAVTVQADGKIVAVGSDGPGFAVARYGTDGVLDPSFGAGGKVPFTFPAGSFGFPGGDASAVVVQPDGKLVVTGGCGATSVMARLNADGVLDAGFGIGGKVGECIGGPRLAVVGTRVALLPGGRILVAVSTQGVGAGTQLLRYEANGNLDTTFGVPGPVTTDLRQYIPATTFRLENVGLRLQADGKIVVAGAVTTAEPVGPDIPFSFGVARFNANGTLDSGFGRNGRVVLHLGGEDAAADVHVQPDGKLLVVGSGGPVTNGTVAASLLLGRLLPDGRPDFSFGTAGSVTVAVGASNSRAAQAVFLADGRLIVVGTAFGGTTRDDFFLTRFTTTDTFTTANARYVGQLYLNLLGRPADPVGLAAFVSLLDRGEATRTQVAQVITQSEEYRSVVVRNLYRTLLGREADPGGLSAFVGFLRGGSVAQLKAVLLGSDEYFRRAGSTHDGFLGMLYRDVLGRDPDASGRQHFGQALAAGAARGVVAQGVVASRESLERIVRGWYRQSFRRDADAGGLAGFVGFLQTGGREDTALALILSSGEFTAGL